MENTELNLKEMDKKELEHVNGGQDNDMVTDKPDNPFPQPVGYPMPRPHD